MAEASSPERKASTLLLLIAARAVVPGSFVEKKRDAADEEHRTQTMMYAARMRYLDDTDQIKPDPLFMTRKQAQKIAQRHDTLTLKRLDVGPQTRKANGTSSAANTGLAKKANHRASMDERNQVWEAKFQAGCRFWQNCETSECRTTPPPNARHIGEFPLDGSGDDDDDDDDENPPFPDSFAFLDSGGR